MISRLGAGGMGEVWRARDSRLQREVAIKVLPADLGSDAGRLKRFEKEARSASALNHPNIVTIYDIGSSDSVSWIAMELVEGKTLRELLFAGALPVKRVLSIGSQVADGLARAHEAGIVHRDLKPENVMVTKDGRVKVLDFGLAKLTYAGVESGEGTNIATETGTGAGVILGTVGYMSPEQAGGQPVDYRSDQFSFGSILYELLTGKRAFVGKTGVDTLSAILNDEPAPIATINPQVPTPLRWIVERCLAKAAEDRYASTLDLARDLAGIRDHLSETGVTAAVSSATREERSWRPPPSPSRLSSRARSSPIALCLLSSSSLSGAVTSAPPDSLRTVKRSCSARAGKASQSSCTKPVLEDPNPDRSDCGVSFFPSPLPERSRCFPFQDKRSGSYRSEGDLRGSSWRKSPKPTGRPTVRSSRSCIGSRAGIVSNTRSVRSCTRPRTGSTTFTSRGRATGSRFEN
ncbi:MAG: hypothetical protein DMF54_15905 [Acidobacteria bacterium]|nr:MAG: hypothetical protein DMF54_15905 [Acidobacteriota bacterium]